MRIWIGTVVALVAGVMAGFGSTWLEFRSVTESFRPVSRTKAGMPLPADVANLSGPLAVVVGGPTFDFGTLDHDQSREKTFVIRNEGNKPLELDWGGESCGKCIENKHGFKKTVVPPGEQCEIIVTYSAKKPSTEFSESAYLTTNDPRASSLQLQITGVVTLALKLSPDSLSLSSILATESTSGSVRLYGYQHERLELVKYELSDTSLAPLIELTPKPLDAAALQDEKYARAGLELQFQFQAGMPIGPFSQTVKLTALTDTEHVIELGIKGTVVGDLSIFGRNYDANSGTLSLGVIPSASGTERDLFVLVKGPSRDSVQLSVAEVDPADVLQVTVGNPEAMSTGKAVKFPIKIVIPPGTRSMSRMGNQQSKPARLVLTTTHPTAKTLPITVRFAVDE